MARAKTQTKTRAKTSSKTTTRMSYIKMQVRHLLEGSVDLSSSMLAKVSRGIEEHIICQIHLSGENEDGLSYVRVILSVDWDEHERQLEVASSIALEDDNEKSLEVEVALEAFNEIVEEQGLGTRWWPTYDPELDYDWANGHLGFVRGDPFVWAPGKIIEKEFKSKKAPEVRVILQAIDDRH